MDRTEASFISGIEMCVEWFSGGPRGRGRKRTSSYDRTPPGGQLPVKSDPRGTNHHLVSIYAIICSLIKYHNSLLHLSTSVNVSPFDINYCSSLAIQYLFLIRLCQICLLCPDRTHWTVYKSPICFSCLNNHLEVIAGQVHGFFLFLLFSLSTTFLWIMNRLNFSVPFGNRPERHDGYSRTGPGPSHPLPSSGYSWVPLVRTYDWCLLLFICLFG